MKVADIMSRDVITIGPQASIHEAAQLLVNHSVSGLPVVDDQDAVVGMLSEGDLIVRQKARTRPAWWTFFFKDAQRLARDYQKTTGTTVGEVMNRPVVSVPPELPIESAAATLDTLRIRRLPVISDGRLVGIVSRGDLIKALATASAQPPGLRADHALVAEMRERLSREAWVSNRGIVIQATNGALWLWGLVDSTDEKAALETMARTIDGCKGVDNHLIVKAKTSGA